VVVVCRTFINQEAFDNWSESVEPTEGPGGGCTGTTDAESFMAAMEADCRDRAERRRQNEEVADRLRLDGNVAFNAGDYLHAVELYTEALSHVRYWTKLYTNRAQAYLQLSKFQVLRPDLQDSLRQAYGSC